MTYSEESLIFENYGDELVASLLTGEPYISDELNESGEEVYRNINKPAPITIVIRPNKALLVFAPNKPLQGTLAQAIGEKIFGLTNVPKKQEQSQAFDLQKIPICQVQPSAGYPGRHGVSFGCVCTLSALLHK